MAASIYPCNIKVDQRNAAVRADNDVLRLDIPVYDRLIPMMEISENITDPGADPCDLFYG